jgi:chemotaxis protein histidine kinase CheA
MIDPQYSVGQARLLAILRGALKETACLSDVLIVSEQQDIIREFLIESNENLNRLDQDMVQLEQRPGDKELLGSVFRTIHTIKGTCGFLGFKVLERITHHAESLLSQLRSGERQLSNLLVELILETVDAARKILVAIEATEAEGPDEYPDLVRRLESTCAGAAPASVAPEEPRADAAAEAPGPPDPARLETEKTSAAADSAIRVDVGLLDKLMNLVGELVLARNQVLQFNTQKGWRAERHLAASEPDHQRIAGQRHEDAHAADRGGLEQTAPPGARYGPRLRQTGASRTGRFRHRAGQDHH